MLMQSNAYGEKNILPMDQVVGSELTMTTQEKKGCGINQQFYEEISSIFCKVKRRKLNVKMAWKRNRKKEKSLDCTILVYLPIECCMQFRSLSLTGQSMTTHQ